MLRKLLFFLGVAVFTGASSLYAQREIRIHKGSKVYVVKLFEEELFEGLMARIRSDADCGDSEFYLVCEGERVEDISVFDDVADGFPASCILVTYVRSGG